MLDTPPGDRPLPPRRGNTPLAVRTSTGPPGWDASPKSTLALPPAVRPVVLLRGSTPRLVTTFRHSPGTAVSAIPIKLALPPAVWPVPPRLGNLPLLVRMAPSLSVLGLLQRRPARALLPGSAARPPSGTQSLSGVPPQPFVDEVTSPRPAAPAGSSTAGPGKSAATPCSGALPALPFNASPAVKARTGALMPALQEAAVV
mmetsp:Transcript_117871/g.328319  ORF Transcript_117871/g.328319 Transcript_117871/m.328319 type:complete len:201 (-) Transcript_117871:277-879(-)